MRKILTVSIAAFNVERYIRKALESIAKSTTIDKIEVFVVDDGATDKTMLIAEEYQKRYPDSFFLIYKENGGYGTTINATIQRASGKYYKVLDGDDWFDTEGLDNLVNILEKSEEDIIITNYYRWIGEERCKQHITHKEPEGTVVDVTNLNASGDVFGMWEIVYKMDLLRKSKLELPAHTLYTDRHYSTIPFAYADSLKFTDSKVYCYRLGRDGQSMTPESQVNHYEERFRGSFDLCEFYEVEKNKKNPRSKYLLNKVAASHVQTASVVRYMKKSKDSLRILKEYENTIKNISEDVVKTEWQYGQFGKFLTLCRLTNYAFYWIIPDSILKK